MSEDLNALLGQWDELSRINPFVYGKLWSRFTNGEDVMQEVARELERARSVARALKTDSLGANGLGAFGVVERQGRKATDSEPPSPISPAPAVQAPEAPAMPTPFAQIVAEPPSKPISWFDGLYEHPGLKASDVLVSSYLFRRAMGKGWPVCWPGQDAIAKACRLDRKTVASALRRLEARKMIESGQRRRATGKGKFSSLSNEYHLLPRTGWITIDETPRRRRNQAEATGAVSALLPVEVKGAGSSFLGGLAWSRGTGAVSEAMGKLIEANGNSPEANGANWVPVLQVTHRRTQ